MLLAALPAGAATPTVTEFSSGISSGGVIYGITAAADGKLWFADRGTNQTAGSVNPFNGIESEITPAVSSGMTGMSNGPDGNVYFGGNDLFSNNIGGIVPATGLSRTTYLGGGNPAFPRYPVTGPDGNLWTTEPRDPSDATSPTDATHQDKVSISTPRVDTSGPNDGAHGPIVNPEIPLPGNAFNGDPETIAAGPGDTSGVQNSSLWVAEFTANKIARLTPVFSAGGEGALVTEYSGLTTGAHPEGIALGPD